MSRGAELRRYRVFGYTLESDFPFASRLAPPPSPEAPGTGEAPERPADLTFRCRTGPRGGRIPEAGEALYRSPLRTEDGERVAELYRDGEGHLLRFPGLCDFRVTAGAIDCRLDGAALPAVAPLVEIRLLGPVLALWLERRGHVALHASAVVVDGRAALFAAAGGGGKTSLAAALMERGARLLADDIVAVEAAAGRSFRARPGYPQLRLWPDLAERFLGGTAGLERVHPEHAKLRAPVAASEAPAAGGFGGFHGGPATIARIFLPERRPAGGAGGPISISPLAPREAVVELLRRSFSPAIAEAAGRAAGRLDLLSRLAAAVPVKRLAYPSSLARLGEVAEAVVADLLAR